MCYTSVLVDYDQAIKIQFLDSHLLSFSENGLQQLQVKMVCNNYNLQTRGQFF